MLFLIFMIVAMILFLVSAFGVTSGRINLMSVGLASMALAFIVSNWPT